MLFSLLFKKWQLSLVAVSSVFTYFLVGWIAGIIVLQDAAERKDKVVFLLEQIHYGQFFLKLEPTDWSFFNNEYRPNSQDYKNCQQSIAKIDSLIASGTPPREAYINETFHQIKTYPVASFVHLFTKFLHGHSFHIGTTIPGKLNWNYIKTYPHIFATNVILKIIMWGIIILALAFIKLNWKKLPIYCFLWLPWLSFALFNMPSASEQRYLFPVRLLIILLAVGFLVNKFNRLASMQLTDFQCLFF